MNNISEWIVVRGLLEGVIGESSEVAKEQEIIWKQAKLSGDMDTILAIGDAMVRSIHKQAGNIETLLEILDKLVPVYKASGGTHASHTEGGE